MLCPSCSCDNIPGADHCEQCGTSLMQEDLPATVARTRLERSLAGDTVADLDPAAAIAVPEHTTLAAAVRRMREDRIGCLLVTDHAGRLSGIFTERDVLMRLALATQLDLEAQTVAELMTRDPETVRPDHPLAHALHRMMVGGHRHLPLVDAGGRPTGVIASRDVVHHLDLMVGGTP